MQGSELQPTCNMERTEGKSAVCVHCFLLKHLILVPVKTQGTSLDSPWNNMIQIVL